MSSGGSKSDRKRESFDAQEFTPEELKTIKSLPGASHLIKATKGQKKAKNLNKVQHLDYEDYLEHCETYKSQKEHLKKQKNHLSRYVQELKDVREEHKILNDKENSLKHRWLNFTHTFTREAFGKPYQIVSLSLGSRYFIATCCHKL